MLSFINNWASGVVVAVVIGTLLEMILPEGKNKKYVKTVIGFFILFTIVSPVITHFAGETVSLTDIYEYENVVPTNTVEVSSIAQDENIEKVYIDNLKKDIKQNLSANGYQVNNIEIEISTKEKNYGEVISLEIDIGTQEENIDAIKPVVIGEEVPEEAESIEEATRKEIINYIYTTYKIAKDKINIY